MTSTVDARAARKCRNGGSGIDYDSLTLGGIAHPEIHVMRAIALVECANLLIGRYEGSMVQLNSIMSETMTSGITNIMTCGLEFSSMSFDYMMVVEQGEREDSI